MEYFQAKIRELVHRYAIFISHGWVGGSWFPEFRSDICAVDAAANGDVSMGTSNMFRYGESAVATAGLNHTRR